MKLFKLDSSHYAGDSIAGFETLIWTERYRVAGDFKVVVENDITVLDGLPLGALISHNNTREVMIVEDHDVVRNEDKKLIITITGRSFETFAENRVTSGSVAPLTDNDVAIVDLRSSATSAVVARDLLKEKLQPSVASSNDAIPNLTVTTDMRTTDAAMAHIVKRGQLYPIVLEFLGLNDAGIKTQRPLGLSGTLDLIIHDGDDLTGSVVFYAQFEDLGDAKYFWSVQDYKNYAQIATLIYNETYRDRNVLSNQTGLNRRELYVEARDLEDNYTQSPSNVVSSRAQAELDLHQGVSLLSATISKTARPKFKIDYDVGDLVLVFGEFGAAQVMRVTEHILTVDKNGMQGYPALEIV